MNISNQKNGRMGKNLHHESTVPKGKVAALARTVAHIMSNGGTEENLLYDYFQTKTWESVQNSDIVAVFRGAARPST